MKIQLIASMIFLTLGLQAQTYVDIPWREGSVTIAGIEQQGMIRLGGDLGAPWLNHTKVYFVPQQDFPENKHPKGKVIIEYEPEMIEAYSTYTKDQEGNQIDMNFETHEILVVKSLSKKITKVFLRRVEKGAINIYSFTPKPEDNSSTEYQYALNHATSYFKKGDGDIISAVECDMSSYLSDCPKVVERIKSGAYGFADLNDREKKKGLGKLMSDGMGDNALETQICMAVSDYNICPK